MTALPQSDADIGYFTHLMEKSKDDIPALTRVGFCFVWLPLMAPISDLQFDIFHFQIRVALAFFNA